MKEDLIENCIQKNLRFKLFPNLAEVDKVYKCTGLTAKEFVELANNMRNKGILSMTPGRAYTRRPVYDSEEERQISEEYWRMFGPRKVAVDPSGPWRYVEIVKK